MIWFSILKQKFIVENTHEALVDKETFEYCQAIRKGFNRQYKVKIEREIRLFEGKLFCKECGNKLTVSYRRNHDYWTVNCNKYSRDPLRVRCTSHFFPYNYLEEQLIEKIDEDVNTYIKKLDVKKLNSEIAKNVKESTNKIDNIINQLEVDKKKLTKRLTILYEDRCNEVISADMYKELSQEYDEKLSEINRKVELQKMERYRVKNTKDITPDYTKQIKELLNLKKSKKDLYDLLIDRIVIDQERNITIKYKFNVIPDKEFKYENRNLARNPYGRSGKNGKKSKENKNN